MSFSILIPAALFILGLLACCALTMFSVYSGQIPVFILRRLFEKSSDHVAILDSKGRYRYWNARLEEESNVSRKEIIGKRAEEALPQESIGKAQEGIDQALDGVIYREMPILIQAENQIVNWRQVDYYPIRGVNNKVNGVYITARATRDLYQMSQMINRQAILLRSVRDAIIGSDVNNIITDWNMASEALYGYTSTEIIGKHSSILSAEPLNDPAHREFMHDIRMKGVWQGQMIHVTKAGKRLYVDCAISTIVDASGNLQGYVSINRDITERVRVLDALHQSEERFSKIFHASPVGISITSFKEGRFFDVNNSLLATVDYKREELVGHTLSELHLWVNFEQREEVLRTLAEKRSIPQVEVELRTKNGDLRQMLIGFELIELDGESYVLSMYNDISERKRMEKDLRQLNIELEHRVDERTTQLAHDQAILQAILDAMGEGVIYSKNYRILYANRALGELTGYNPIELIGQPNTILISENATAEEVLPFKEDMTVPGQTWRGETRLRRRDNTEFDAALTISLFYDPVGKFVGAATIVRDITAEKQLEEEKTRFIANASHELRTPLTNIKTRLYILCQQPEKFDEHTKVLQRVTDHMVHLVEDLLEVTRFERDMIVLDPEPMNLSELITDVVELQRPEAENKKITLSAQVPPEPVEIVADQTRVTQVVINLIVNAINYTPEQGCISVFLNTATQNDQTFAVIQVQDTGIGISPENLPRIFDPFFRANKNAARGTGLGLSIAKEIIERHGGSLSVESQLDKGSTFTVRLALEPPLEE